MNALGSVSSSIFSVYHDLSSAIELHCASEVEQVISILSEAGSDDLILFDVDEVLITLRDRFLRPKAAPFNDPIFMKLFYPWSDNQKVSLFGEWISQVEVEVVNPKLIEALKGFQNARIPTIALTRMMPGPGPCGKIPLMEDFRFHELQSHGIDFSQSFNIERLELGFAPKNGRTPIFKKGILYALPYTKGEVLHVFLNKIGYRPKKIWFVDNDQRQIDNVAKSVSELHIPYAGIRYLDKLLQEEDFDRELGLFQYEHFEKTGVWLNDNAAREKLKTASAC